VGPQGRFSRTWQDGLDHGDADMRFYIDRNGNGQYDAGEPQKESKESPDFRVERIYTYELDVEYSNQLLASEPNVASLIPARFADAEQRVLRKDSADDWRGCVKFNCASVSQFAAGPDRPDPVLTRADAVLHWDDDCDVAFVEALDHPEAITIGYSNIGRVYEIIIEWHGGVEKTIAHEIGHGAGISGDYGKPGGTPDPGSLGDRNIMWYRNTGTCQELYKEDADVYD